jgi:hypothetical protein
MIRSGEVERLTGSAGEIEESGVMEWWSNGALKKKFRKG